MFALAACRSATVPEPRTVPLPSAAQLQLAPARMRVVLGDREQIALTDEGCVTLEGATFGRIEGTRVVDVAGAPLATVTPDGTVRFRGATHDARLTADGTLIGPDSTLVLSDDGTVRFIRGGTEALTLRLRVEGITATSRATAAVLVGVLMTHARTQRSDTP
jgi:hypothetical protein